MNGHEHEHTHVLPDGTEITHSHNHTHTHENTKQVMNRLARAAGHLEKVRNMVESGEDCSQILIQLAAVRSALNNTGKIILKDHVEHCLVEAVREGDHETIEELKKAIDMFM